MDARQREHFRRRLEQEREAVNARILAAQRDAQQANDDPLDDMGEEPIRDHEVDVAFGLGTLLTEQLHEIDDALVRLELDEYGICEKCGREIDLERLEALPATRLCRDDARRAEQHQRRPTL